MKDLSKLRKTHRSKNAEYRVVKNTLFKRALKEVGITGLDDHLKGPVAVAFMKTEIGEVAKALKESLEFIAYKATWDDVPATTEKSCGNYRDHSLFTAKEWAKQILEEGISSDPFERKVV